MISACLRGPSRHETVASYERIFNSHKIDLLMTFFSDSAQIDLAGMGVSLAGKKMLSDKARYDSTLDTRITISINGAKRDTVFASAIETNKWLTQAGLPPSVYSSYLFIINKKKINVVWAELSDSSVAAINNVMEQLIPWAQENEPDKLNQLLPQWIFTYNVKSAELSLELLSDWQNRIRY